MFIANLLAAAAVKTLGIVNQISVARITCKARRAGRI